PILKERLFGLTNSEGNHGEDVKEYYFYLDSTPTHSYMRYLYKYPQGAYPYTDLVETNRRCGRCDPEYELIDTGIFNDDRYFDVTIEYAKAEPEDILIRITAANRGPDDAPLHVLPTLWFRNIWLRSEVSDRPLMRIAERDDAFSRVTTSHPLLGNFVLSCEGSVQVLFTNNENNNERLFGTPNRTKYVKDGINNYIVHGTREAVNPEQQGTKCSAHYLLTVPARGEQTIRLRLSRDNEHGVPGLLDAFEDIFAMRLRECDAFYAALTPPQLSKDEALIMRQALAGMLWTKQYYSIHVNTWLHHHGVDTSLVIPRDKRNADWFHMVNNDIISMPDKWEYPWYAAWDLAFHTAALAMVDLDFAKKQLALMLEDVYQHPNGQIPAYEWNFSDVNPPVHAWASLFMFSLEEETNGVGDLQFLRRVFHKLLLNFTWWVNRKDPSGRNVFEGGFLGLDNIGVFDRSRPLPTGGYLDQADGTAWMALFSQNMFEMALELAEHDPVYEDLALKFLEHFFWIASAMDRMGDNKDEMWDEEDGFYYDLLRFPNGDACRLKVRSLVGLLPLCATSVFPESIIRTFPKLDEQARGFVAHNPHVLRNIASPGKPGYARRRLSAIVDENKLRRILRVMLDEDEFLSPYGIRSLSRFHREHPYEFHHNGECFRVTYLPAESDSGMFGGNSNWRGPIWFPLNALLIRALLQFYLYYGDDFKVECPTGSGSVMNLFEVARELSHRLAGIFVRDAGGRRAVFGGVDKFQTDPYWRDCIPFYEYFHGDNGAGIGASHQTGWTGLVARFIQFFGHVAGPELLNADGTRPLTRAFLRRPPRVTQVSA
ncbi:MAG: glucosidase, partial [Bryobacteraceae bacterium]|nr:glucosidase [Bryobacteraceae bacterium]